jgi:uroporphyrin-3 C-methyltransferase
MSLEPSPPADATATVAAAPARPRRGNLVPRWVREPALWLALAALLTLAWDWFDTRARFDALQQELARRIAQTDEAARESRALARQNQEMLQAMQAKAGVLEAKLAESENQRVALEAMYQELSRNPDDRVAAEVEQAVSLAVQQIEIAGNAGAALVALQAAEARLARADSTQFLGLRRALAQDIERLKALPAVDIAGLALRLDGVSRLVDEMPFAYEVRPRDAGPAAGEPARSMFLAWVQDLWRELRQLIHIERLERHDPGLVAPEQAYFLRENLRLRLLSARLALLARDGSNFREDVRQALAWIERWFDPDHKAVKGALASLRPLATTELVVDLPHLGESVAAMRSLKLGRERRVQAAR